ncbi:MAG: transposase [Methylobacter sp.]
MYHFQSAEQLAAYSILVPMERQSGSSIVGRPRLSKAHRTNACKNAVKLKCRRSAPPCAKRVHVCFGVLKSR